MDNNFDFNSKKYMILLILICLVFSIFIIKAFDYLPDNNVYDESDNIIENINTPSSNVNKPITVDNIDKKQKPIQKSGVLYRSNDSLSANNGGKDEMVFEEIDAPDGVVEDNYSSDIKSENSNSQLTTDELAIKSILKAKNYAKNNNLQASIDEYKNALSITNDEELKALSYDGIALIYAKNQKYNTALSFASKANEASPSIARQFIIAKIYYSAGKTDIAITKINNILKKGFNN